MPSTNRSASCADSRPIEGVHLAPPVRSWLPLPLKTRARAQGHGRLAKSQTEDRQFGGPWAREKITYRIGLINQRQTCSGRGIFWGNRDAGNYLSRARNLSNFVGPPLCCRRPVCPQRAARLRRDLLLLSSRSLFQTPELRSSLTPFRRPGTASYLRKYMNYPC